MFLLISPSTRCLEYPIAPAAYDWNLYLRNNFSCRVFLLFLASLYLSLSPLTMFDEKVTFFSIPLKYF